MLDGKVYLVIWQNPGQQPDKREMRDLREAEALAAEKGHRGAGVTLYAKDGRKRRTLMARYGPNQQHDSTRDGDTMLCTCGRKVTRQSEWALFDQHLKLAKYRYLLIGDTETEDHKEEG